MTADEISENIAAAAKTIAAKAPKVMMHKLDEQG